MTAGTAFAATVGPSHGVEPPRAELRAGGKSQDGGLVWEEWTSGGPRFCTALSGDGTGRFPKPLRLGPGAHRPRFVLFRRQKPSDLQITAWHELDDTGSPVGRGEDLPVVLEPRRDADGRLTSWRAIFSVTLPPPDYLQLYAEWPDGQCGGPRHFLRTYSIAGGGN